MPENEQEEKRMKNTDLSRRTFLKGMLVATGTAVIGANGMASAIAEEKESYTYADTISWDGEYDVIVLGFGGAGAWSALAAANAGARVLAVDAAPKGKEGGNFRVSGQVFATFTDEESAYAFFKASYEGLDIDDDLARFYAKELTRMDHYLDMIGCPRDQWVDAGAAWGVKSRQNYPGVDARVCYCAHDNLGDAYLWNHLRTACEAKADQIDLWLDSPALHLIKADDTGTVIGVVISHEGKELKIRALNGVVLSTGGYENNPQMISDYHGIPDYVLMAIPYNKGDGVKMAQEAGADLWHFSYDGFGGCWGGAVPPYEKGKMQDSNAMMKIPPMVNGSIYAITQGGTRFINEPQRTDHGRGPWAGTWSHPFWSPRNYMVMDKAGYDELVADGSFEPWLDQFSSGNTLEELAAAIQVDADGLKNMAASLPTIIAMGFDPVCNRDVSTMRAFGEGPFYALPIYPGFHGTRGGPRRNASTEILDPYGNPIPHLYGAGECGSVYANIRSGGGGISECIVFGYKAGEMAAAVKPALPVYHGGEKVSSSMQYMPGSAQSDLPKVDTAFETQENEFIGVSNNAMAGTLKTKVTVNGNTVTGIEVVEHHETEGIGTLAVDQMPGRILEAQSLDVDIVSGATVTSKAILEAVTDALSQAGVAF